jgi:RNA polymerase sigma-70 factor (ECF subfamily)
MVGYAVCNDWKDLDATLRPFVERRVAVAADVDDVLQEIFLRVQRGLAGLRDDERFGPWLFTIARTAIVDHHRRAPRHIAATIANQEAPVEEEIGSDFVERELAKYVAPFVASLPSPYREALTLTELEGIAQKEAADMMGVSLSAMKSRVQRGRVRLRDLFDACCKIALDARGRVIACEPRPDRPVRCECEPIDETSRGRLPRH